MQERRARGQTEYLGYIPPVASDRIATVQSTFSVFLVSR
jgi:hypothetical protein